MPEDSRGFSRDVEVANVAYFKARRAGLLPHPSSRGRGGVCGFLPRANRERRWPLQVSGVASEWWEASAGQSVDGKVMSDFLL